MSLIDELLKHIQEVGSTLSKGSVGQNLRADGRQLATNIQQAFPILNADPTDPKTMVQNAPVFGLTFVPAKYSLIETAELAKQAGATPEQIWEKYGLGTWPFTGRKFTELDDGDAQLLPFSDIKKIAKQDHEAKFNAVFEAAGVAENLARQETPDLNRALEQFKKESGFEPNIDTPSILPGRTSSLRDMFDFHKQYKAFDTLAEKLNYELVKLYDNWPGRIGPNGRPNPYTVNLPQALNHPALFDYMPKYKDTKLHLEDIGNALGQTDGKDIWLNPLFEKLQSTKPMHTLMHEVQHLVQHDAGWPLGGNKEMFTPENVESVRPQYPVGTSDSLIRQSLYKRLFGEAMARETEARLKWPIWKRRLDYNMPLWSYGPSLGGIHLQDLLDFDYKNKLLKTYSTK